jgi:hypothetical protein
VDGEEVAVRVLVAALRVRARVVVDPQVPLAVLVEPVGDDELVLGPRRGPVLAPIVALVELDLPLADQLPGVLV